MKKTIKLLLAYHKKDVLFKDNVLTPIHAGREIALETKSPDDENLKWLIENTIGDNTGDNISKKNPLYNEMTAVYWAWKNYQELGNPDYIGLMHYRRHFIFKDMPKPNYESEEIKENYLDEIGYSEDKIQEILESYDFVCSAPHWRDSLYSHYEKNHHIEDLNITVQIIKDLWPEYVNATERYLNGHDAFFCNMFIFDKETFFSYSEFLFTTTEELEKRSDMTGKRLFISEWLTGIFITKLIERGMKPKYLPTILTEGDHTIPVALATDNGYAFPLFITLTSMFENAHKNTFYDVNLLLSGEFSQENKNRLQILQRQYTRHKITIYDMGNQYSDAYIKISHISCPTFYRLKLPSILSSIDKCLYLDVDVTVQKDLSELYRINVDDKYIAGVLAAGYLYPDSKVKENIEELEIPDMNQYVNAGVLILNLKNMRKDGLETVFESLLCKNYSCSDQHILNKACYGKIRILPPHFNVMTKYNPQNEDSYKNMKELQKAYKLKEWEIARNNPTIIHYADKIKPWQDISSPFAHVWWDFAEKTPFFTDIYNEYKNAFYEIGYKYGNIKNLITKLNDVKFKYFNMCRIDLEVTEGGSNNIEVLYCTGTEKLVKAPWYKKENGTMYWIHNNTGYLKFSFKVINNGNLSICLRGPDVKDENRCRIPFKLKYTKFIVNGQVQKSDSKIVWHDNPIYYRKNVISGEIIDVFVEWVPLTYPNYNMVDINSFDKVKRELVNIKKSKSYKLGRYITWIPRKVRNIVKKIFKPRQ